MPDRPHNNWRFNRLSRAAKPAAITCFTLLATYVLYDVWLLRGHDQLPVPQIHTLVVGTLATAGLVSLIAYCYLSVRHQLARLETLTVETSLHHAQALARVHSAFVEELARRSDVSTDRLRAIVRTEVSGYGPDAEVVPLPSGETREAFRRVIAKINGGASGDTVGDIRSARNVRE